jgi:DNA-binding transcriptional ArsR family regulator
MIPMSSPIPAPMPKPARRAATPEEAKALANPLRLRILRLCLDRALTNKQLAGHLGKDPGTILHHVRTLVATGFLAAEQVRQGEHGAFEKPYRATGKSWVLDVSDTAGGDWSPIVSQASLEAFRAEVEEAGPDAMVNDMRLALVLDDASLRELSERVLEVIEDFRVRPPSPDGTHYGIYVGIHRRRLVEEPGPGEA